MGSSRIVSHIDQSNKTANSTLHQPLGVTMVAPNIPDWTVIPIVTLVQVVTISQSTATATPAHLEALRALTGSFIENKYGKLAISSSGKTTANTQAVTAPPGNCISWITLGKSSNWKSCVTAKTSIAGQAQMPAKRLGCV